MTVLPMSKTHLAFFNLHVVFHKHTIALACEIIDAHNMSAKVVHMTSCAISNKNSPEADLPSIVLIACHQIRIVQETVIIEKCFRCSLVVGRVGQLNVAAPCRDTLGIAIYGTRACAH